MPRCRCRHQVSKSPTTSRRGRGGPQKLRTRTASALRDVVGDVRGRDSPALWPIRWDAHAPRVDEDRPTIVLPGWQVARRTCPARPPTRDRRCRICPCAFAHAPAWSTRARVYESPGWPRPPLVDHLRSAEEHRIENCLDLIKWSRNG